MKLIKLDAFRELSKVHLEVMLREDPQMGLIVMRDAFTEEGKFIEVELTCLDEQTKRVHVATFLVSDTTLHDSTFSFNILKSLVEDELRRKQHNNETIL